MKKEETLLFLILTSIACNQSVHPNNKATGAAGNQTTVAKGVQQLQGPPTPSDTSFRLQFLVPLPDTMDGVGESFTYDTTNLNSEQYIFMSDFELGIIKVNGKNIYLHKDTTESKFVEHKSDFLVYRGSGYKVIFDLKIDSQIDYVWYSSGTMQIVSDKIKKKFKVNGVSGD